MSQKIQRDQRRFKRIIKGKIKKNLRDYMSNHELTGQQGGKEVKIPIPRIDLPRFTHNSKESGGTGQGEGEVGDSLGKGDPQDGEGEPGEAGDQAGDHGLDVNVSYEELAELMGEELELPNIEPKSGESMETESRKYTGIRKVGNEGLRHFKRTYKEALKRQIAQGTYDPDNPVIIPRREDKRYRCSVPEQKPETNAAIIYIMDVSGSMGDKQKNIVRSQSFWINTWLKSQYEGIQTRYLIHDAEAREVDEEVFFTTRESGGTKISSSYLLCSKIMEEDYPYSDWNVYVFQFSDGDNWGGTDNDVCVKTMRDSILPNCNAFCYGQVDSPYGSGDFKGVLEENFNSEHLIIDEILNPDEIYDSIKKFLGKGL